LQQPDIRENQISEDALVDARGSESRHDRERAVLLADESVLPMVYARGRGRNRIQPAETSTTAIALGCAT
jgi:hypothetical protein